MKKALVRNNIILLLSAFVLFFTIVFFAIYRFEKNNQTEFMRYVIDEVELSYQHADLDPIEFVNTYQNDNERRITILDSDARVLADTHDLIVGTDKSERPEIKNLGYIYIRTSATINQNLVYIAKQMDDGQYLRVAVSTDAQMIAYNQVIWIFVFSSLGFIGLFYIGLIQVNKNLLSPWEKVKQGLILLSEGKYQVMSLNSPYPEINEIIYEMNDINLKTANYVQAIEAYQLQLNKILNQMKQGVMLFDKDERLIYYNADAKNLYDLSDDSLKQPSYFAIRNNQIKDAISRANIEKIESSFDTVLGNKTIETKVFFVSTQNITQHEATVLVLFKDVTQERAIEQMKRDFFSHASHELKSPLTAIKGHAELIEHQVVTKEDILSSAHMIVKQSETMTALVEDMLMLSRLENLKEKRYSKQQIHHILSNVIDQLETVASAKLVQININSQPIEMMCDPLDMQKLFKNLIENAIKYSEENKQIDIELKQEQDIVEFRVKDQGIGIGLEHQQRVFERFYRVDKGRLDGGTGLGLAIVKHIVLKYEGTIDLQSGLTKGTTIVVKIKHQ